MSLHSSMFTSSGLPCLKYQFKESAVQWPLGVEADALEHEGVFIEWRSADWNEKYGVLAEEIDVLIGLDISVAVNGGGKDTFVLTDPTTQDSIKFAADSLVSRNGSRQTWSLKRIEVREIAREGYRR